MELDARCPLCAEAGPRPQPGHAHRAQPGHAHRALHLHQIIYKHLHIKLNNKRAEDVCSVCKRTVVDWDEFARKCWSTHGSLAGDANTADELKTEVEIKIESEENGCRDDIYGDDDQQEKFLVKDEDSLINIEIGKIESRRRVTKRRVSKKIAISEMDESRDSNVDSGPEAPLDDRFKNDDCEEKTTLKNIINPDCYICSAKTKSWCAAVKHFTEFHPSIKPKVLCLCGVLLSAQSAFYMHRKLHDETKAFKCEECGKKFAEKRALREHMLRHNDDDYDYKCSQCQRKFVDAHLYKKHVATHLPRELKNIHPCDICGVKFTTRSNVQLHKSVKHADKKDQICDICGMAFKVKGQLVSHRDTHNVEKNFHCDKCDMKFKSKALLKAHLANVHSEKTVQCPMCSAVCKNVKAYRAHKIMHEDVFKHTCTECGKKFKRTCKLKMHMDSHLGIKPYTCHLCSNLFANSQNLNMHMKRAHPDYFLETNPANPFNS